MEVTSQTLFIFDFVADTVMGAILEWFYAQIVGFLGEFFAQISEMGAELFDTPWVTGLTTFFSYLAWGLFVVGLIVAGFEYAIESQTGRASMKDLALNAFKGFMAVSLFSVLPVELYKFSISLQYTFAGAIKNSFNVSNINLGSLADAAMQGMKMPAGPVALWTIFCIIMIGYAVIKVFFANLKRGGILLIQIAVGSLYLFSVPRGYMDGFVQWSKQVIGLCLTAFLQVTILTVGLLVLKDHVLLGFGLMLSSTEVPRIAGAFGLETGTKANIMSTVYAAQTVVNMTSKVFRAVPK